MSTSRHFAEYKQFRFAALRAIERGVSAFFRFPRVDNYLSMLCRVHVQIFILLLYSVT